jgi:hypothetical protein
MMKMKSPPRSYPGGIVGPDVMVGKDGNGAPVRPAAALGRSYAGSVTRTPPASRRRSLPGRHVFQPASVFQSRQRQDLQAGIADMPRNARRRMHVARLREAIDESPRGSASRSVSSAPAQYAWIAVCSSMLIPTAR